LSPKTLIKLIRTELVVVKVIFPSVLLEVTCERQVSVIAETISDVVDRLILLYGRPFKEKLFDRGELIRFWQIFVNGVNIRLRDHVDTKVQIDRSKANP